MSRRVCQNQDALVLGEGFHWVRVELCQNQGGAMVWGQQLRCTNEISHLVFLGGRTVRKFCAGCAAEISERGRREKFKVRIEEIANREVDE